MVNYANGKVYRLVNNMDEKFTLGALAILCIKEKMVIKEMP